METTVLPSRWDGRLALNPAEAAEALSVSRSSIYQLVRDGRLDYFAAGKTGRGVRIPVTSLLAFMQQQVAATKSGGR